MKLPPNQPKLRVALTTDCFWPRVNGVTVAVQTLLEQFLALGHEVLVIAPEYEMNQPADPSQIQRVDARPSKVSPEDRLATHKGISQAVVILQEFKPDIIHSHTEFALTKAAKIYARESNIPLVMTSHTYFEPYVQHYMPYMPLWFIRIFALNYTKRNFKAANVIITPGIAMVETLMGYGIKTRIVNIPTGIDPKPFSGEKRTLGKGSFHLLYVGRIAREKNVFFLLDVLERLVGDFPGIVLRLVGDGPSRKELEEDAEKRGLTSSLEFVGYQPHEEIASYYKNSDVFVFPSRTETQGLVTLESLMTGTPVVAVGERGSAEVLREGDGAHLTINDPAIFSDQVKRLLSDSSYWETMSGKAKEYAKDWTAPALALKLEKLYRELVSPLSI